MIISKEVLIKWHSSTKEHYERKGYKFTQYHEDFTVKVDDLFEGSQVKIKVSCDFCGMNTKDPTSLLSNP